MEILPMLVRLENALNHPNLAKQMMLVPTASIAKSVSDSADINLVVGYNGSTRSQTALDLTLWIAHQTRLATRKAVTVQVVYVVDETNDRSSAPDHFLEYCLSSLDVRPESFGKARSDVCTQREASDTLASGSVAILSSGAIAADWSELVPEVSPATNQQIHEFEKADRILWQARHLADEWRGSLETHLRFGRLAEELHAVACQVAPTALILGCSSANDPIVQALGPDLPFPILGIPAQTPDC